jgi:hypothetical protein
LSFIKHRQGFTVFPKPVQDVRMLKTQVELFLSLYELNRFVKSLGLNQSNNDGLA